MSQYFGELKVDEEIILSEEYSSSDESDEYQSRRNKNLKPKYSSELQGYKKVHVPGNGIVYFNHYICLHLMDTLVHMLKDNY